MKVYELIEKLQTMPSELDVMMVFTEGGVGYVKSVYTHQMGQTRTLPPCPVGNYDCINEWTIDRVIGDIFPAVVVDCGSAPENANKL